MTNATLKECFVAARDNLRVLAQQALTNSVGTYDYITVKPNAYPLIQFIISNGRRTRISSTQQSFAVNFNMRIICAEFFQQFEGQAQDAAQFDYLPTVLQYFEAHGNLKTSTAPIPPYLDAVNSGITDYGATVRDNKIVLELNWNLIFMTSIQRC